MERPIAKEVFNVEYVEGLEKQVHILKEALNTVIDECRFPEHMEILTNMAEKALKEAKEEDEK